MTTTDAPFGSLLRRYRTAAGLTQEELAERAGISPRAISALERGDRRSPHRDTVEQLAAALGLSPSERERFSVAARGGLVAGSAPHTPAHGTPFVGREGERGRLERQLEGEGPPVAVLAGEPGIGKTRLLDEIVPVPRGLGMTVLRGGCSRRSGEEPYAPLLEALARNISSLPAASRRDALDGCDWLVRLMPELGFEVPSLGAGQERRLVHAAVTRFLRNVAGPGGTLLLLDDLQWASTDALDLLGLLVRSKELPLRVVGAYRDTEVGPDAPLSTLLADLAHAHLVTRIPLGPLPGDAAMQLLDSLLPGLPRTEVERRVLARASGVPFFLVSCAQELQSGALRSGGEDVPWDIAQSIRQRAAGLPAEAREVLGAAAVIGRTVPVAVLLSVAALEEDVVVDGLDAACNARLLEEEGSQAYRFSHDVIREVVDADLRPARRAVLHRRAAQALERAGGGSVEAVAYHYERSGDVEQTAEWAERAGDRAARMYASSDAVAHYERAHRALSRLGADRVVLARLEEKMGPPLYMSGQYAGAIAVLEQALATYRALGDNEKARSVSARIGKTYFESGQIPEGFRYVRPLLENPTDSPGTAQLFVVLAHLFWRTLQYRESLAAAERGAALAERFGARQVLAEAETRRGTALWKLGRWREGQAAMERAAVLAESGFQETVEEHSWDRVSDLETTSRTLSNLGELQMLRGDLVGAEASLDRALLWMERRKGPSGIVFITTLFCRLLFLRGRWVEARERLEEVIELSNTFSHSWVPVFPRMERARLDLAEGRWDDLAKELHVCRTMSEQNDNPQALDLADALAAEHDLAEGRPGDAHDRLLGVLARPTEDVYRDLAVLALLAEAEIALGRPEDAERRSAATILSSEEYGDRLHLIDLLRVQGLALNTLGRPEEAHGALERSLVLARESGTPYPEARSLQGLSAYWRACGHEAEADRAMEAAAEICRRLGARVP